MMRLKKDKPNSVRHKNVSFPWFIHLLACEAIDINVKYQP